MKDPNCVSRLEKIGPSPEWSKRENEGGEVIRRETSDRFLLSLGE